VFVAAVATTFPVTGLTPSSTNTTSRFIAVSAVLAIKVTVPLTA